MSYSYFFRLARLSLLFPHTLQIWRTKRDGDDIVCIGRVRRMTVDRGWHLDHGSIILGQDAGIARTWRTETIKYAVVVYERVRPLSSIILDDLSI